MSRRLRRLFVTDIRSRSGSRDAKSLFTDLGEVTAYEIKDGNGYVEYENPKDAARAIRKLDGKKFSRSKIRVEYAVKSTNKFMDGEIKSKDQLKREGRCFKCKERGHLSKDCDGERRSRRRSPSSSSSRSRSHTKKKKHHHHRSRSRNKSKKHRKHRSKSRSRDHRKKRGRSSSRTHSKPKHKHSRSKSGPKDGGTSSNKAHNGNSTNNESKKKVAAEPSPRRSDSDESGSD